ncbi:MAG: hypothetical protein ACM3MK_10715 [Chitinophagales bacterium]
MDKRRGSAALTWIPRVLAMMFIIFISLFAFDTFSNGEPLVRSLIGFLIHLIPSFVLLIILVISWKRPIVGGCIFIFTGIALAIFWGTYKDLTRFLLLSLPVLVTGIMFIISHYSRNEIIA